jgi:probable phosphoglycerate mutase
MTTVLLLRHAESADPSIFHGAESDIGLSERGKRQADAVAAWLTAHRPCECRSGGVPSSAAAESSELVPNLHSAGATVVVSSAMTRARDTAAAIARAYGRPLLLEPALHERRVGPLSGTPNSLPEGPWPKTLKRWLAGETGYAPEGAESFDDIRARVLPVWERLTTAHRGKRLVIVAHGVVCKVLLLSLLPGHSIADWPRLGPIHNVSISELVREETGWRALLLNARVVEE